MPDYKTLYYNLFGDITDKIQQLSEKIEYLKQIQCKAEERYMNAASANADETGRA